MKRHSLLVAILSLGLFAGLLLGCDDSSDSSNSGAADPSLENPADESEDPDSDATTNSDPQEQSEEATNLISSEGIGVAQLGMTFSELKQDLGDGVEYVVESPFIVDFDAIAVRQNGEVQFYILYLSSEAFDDDSIIQGLLTTNSAFHTAENVGPGTSIAEAENAYGNATLAYNLANESREYVRFENHPANNVLFGTYGGGSLPREYAGIYSEPTAEYNETEEYTEEASIGAVLVTCLAETCS